VFAELKLTDPREKPVDRRLAERAHHW
jgi:hypothetical protein